MILLWSIAGASLVAALMAWGQARRTAKRLEQLSQMCWELKYQLGELRVQLQRAGSDPVQAATPAPPATDAYIPITSLKRR